MIRLHRLAAAALIGLAFAAPALHAQETETMPFTPHTGDLKSLQRGARDFINYCSGCHSMKYLRYNRLAQDLGIPEDLVKKNLIFTGAKIGDAIETALPSKLGTQWFGRAPPDLTLEAEARGADWIYSYLQSFYLDPSRPLGVNNPYLPNPAMPAVLGSLQGWQVLEKAAPGAEEAGLPHFKTVVPGRMTAEEFRGFVADLTNFMVYAAEPVRAERVRLGWKVLVYLVILTVLFYLLKKEFWRDVH
ncbi:MAG: cytochrome c1 [Nevskia sp.]|nr:cytochrome c1 [Nevskia sp.]